MARKNFSRNLQTTITGVVLLVVTLLATIGVITADQAAALQSGIGLIATAITSIVGAISAIILIFKAQDLNPTPVVSKKKIK